MNELDRSLMLALNFDGGSFMDAIMWFASGIPNWIPLYLLVLYLFWRNYGWKYMLLALLFVGAGVGICDQICNLFKDNVPYLRPTHTEILLPYLHTVNDYYGGLMGTVSGHASTSFCVFLFTSLAMHRKWFTWMMLVYMLLTTYSRIYLGVHFPFQILFGLILGMVVSLLMWYIFSKLNDRYHWAVPRTNADIGVGESSGTGH